MAYCVAETTNIKSGKCFDFIYTTAVVENGSVVAKGALADKLDGTLNAKERCIYNATIPTLGDEIFFVANPAWSYDDSRAVNQNEENYINPAGKPFRAYGLRANMHDRFGVTENGITPVDSTTDVAVGDFIGVDTTTMKLIDLGSTEPLNASSRGFLGKVVYIDDYSSSVIIGSAGAPATGTIETGFKMITVEVIKNETV